MSLLDRPLVRVTLWVVGLLGGGLLAAAAIVGCASSTPSVPVAAANAEPAPRTPTSTSTGAPPDPRLGPLPRRSVPARPSTTSLTATRTTVGLRHEQKRPGGSSTHSRRSTATSAGSRRGGSRTHRSSHAPGRTHEVGHVGIVAAAHGTKHTSTKHTATGHPVGEPHRHGGASTARPNASAIGKRAAEPGVKPTRSGVRTMVHDVGRGGSATSRKTHHAPAVRAHVATTVAHPTTAKQPTSKHPTTAKQPSSKHPTTAKQPTSKHQARAGCSTGHHSTGRSNRSSVHQGASHQGNAAHHQSATRSSSAHRTTQKV